MAEARSFYYLGRLTTGIERRLKCGRVIEIDTLFLCCSSAKTRGQRWDRFVPNDVIYKWLIYTVNIDRQLDRSNQGKSGETGQWRMTKYIILIGWLSDWGNNRLILLVNWLMNWLIGFDARKQHLGLWMRDFVAEGSGMIRTRRITAAKSIYSIAFSHSISVEFLHTGYNAYTVGIATVAHTLRRSALSSARLIPCRISLKAK